MPISDCEVRDPRIRRTRQLLHTALRKIMQAKHFDEISVQDITDEATVNRATFYDHYTDKFDLLDNMVRGDFHRMLAERKIHFDGTCPSAAGALVLATCDYLVQTGSAPECSKQNSIELRKEMAVAGAIGNVLLQGIKDSVTTPPVTPELIANIAAWAIFGAARQWFYTPERPPADAVVEPVLDFVMPILSSAKYPEAAHQMLET
ncbi:MAG TPA: TetR family transcriptional regulator [Edaphobacter sp.]